MLFVPVSPKTSSLVILVTGRAKASAVGLCSARKEERQRRTVGVVVFQPLVWVIGQIALVQEICRGRKVRISMRQEERRGVRSALTVTERCVACTSGQLNSAIRDGVETHLCA